jgi:hypothetical protein
MKPHHRLNLFLLHGYKGDGEKYPSNGKRYEHTDTSHVVVYPYGGWRHKGPNKNLAATEGDSAHELNDHLIAGKKRTARALAPENNKRHRI